MAERARGERPCPDLIAARLYWLALVIPAGPQRWMAMLPITLMRSTITARGQTVIPAPIRAGFALGPSQRLEWFVESDVSIRVVLVAPSPLKAFRGAGRCGGSTQRQVGGTLLHKDPEFRAIPDPARVWVG